MIERKLTMDDDWGANGAQATGAQVQQFIKANIKALYDISNTQNEQLNELSEAKDIINSQLHSATDGCFIAYTQKSNNYLRAVPWWKWQEKEATGEVADGVLVLIDGGAPIIISPTQTSIKWSKNMIAINDNVGSNFNKAYLDNTGKIHTAAIIAKRSELFGDEENWSQYAPAWCNKYDCSHDKGDGTKIGKKSGEWWLPSIAELITIWKHKYAINQCLSVITGADLLSESLYWSSSEHSATYAWCLNLSTGSLSWMSKVLTNLNVRAVTSFH